MGERRRRGKSASSGEGRLRKRPKSRYAAKKQAARKAGQKAPSRRAGTAKPVPVRCRRVDDQLIFSNRLDELAVRQFNQAVGDARKEGKAGFTLNFYDATVAYPDAMLQLIASVDRFRRRNLTFNAMLPENRRLRNLFQNTNWAHLLAPTMFVPSSVSSDRHLPARRYGSAEEQKRVVDDILEVMLRAMEVDRTVLDGLEWSLNEITDNVLNHANSEKGGIVQLTTLRDRSRVRFAVVDSGRGIPASIREGYPHLKRDIEAVGEAIKQGSTRSSDVGQGNGLAGALRISALSGGVFRVVSGRAEVTARHPPDTPEYDQQVHGRPASEAFRGTCVVCEISVAGSLDLDEALNFSGGHTGFGYIDAEYVDGSSKEICLPLAKETAGFGSRKAGQALRIKAINLLRAEPSARLILDWRDVPSISSSFADEFVGRLFVELGPTHYMERVKAVSMEPFARKIVDRAIKQRVAQSL